VPAVERYRKDVLTVVGNGTNADSGRAGCELAAFGAWTIGIKRPTELSVPATVAYP
jgi:hypothetical protein